MREDLLKAADCYYNTLVTHQFEEKADSVYDFVLWCLENEFMLNAKGIKFR